MRSLRSTLPLFFILGLFSGIVCWALQFVLPDRRWIVDYYPAVVLACFLYAAGAHATGGAASRRIPALAILIAASVLGWRLAIEVGYDLGGPAPFVNAGALGALALAAGALLAWRIRRKLMSFTVILIGAGALGGLAFHFLDAWFIGHMQNDHFWVLILFAVWQSIFLAGVAVGLNYSRPE